jgi:hypothetical protein
MRDGMAGGMLQVPEIEWQCDGRFLLLKRGNYEIKFEALPRIDGKDVKFYPRIVLPEPDTEAWGRELIQIAKAFGFENIISFEDEVLFFGKNVDLHITCKTENCVRFTDDGGCFIVYQPKFVLEYIHHI